MQSKNIFINEFYFGHHVGLQHAGRARTRDPDNCADFNQPADGHACSVLSTNHSYHNELQQCWEIARLRNHGSDTRYLEQ